MSHSLFSERSKYGRPRSHSAVLVAACIALAACGERPTAPVATPFVPLPNEAVAAVQCAVQVASGNVHCGSPTGAAAAYNVIIGGQDVFVKLTASNSSYDAGTGTFEMDVTVQNLMNEAIGTPGELSPGTFAPDTNGIRVFFATPPTATSGSGTITVTNADGTGTFTAVGQQYFQYDTVLKKDSVSMPKRWQMNVPSTVGTFTFTVLLSTEVQTLVVFNEILANPGGTISDANGEWFELYNAGTRSIDLQGYFIADSNAAGRRPYHMISSSLPIAPGGFVVLGNTTNTTNNGGVPVDYAYGAALAFANSLDAGKLSRVYGTDTLTVDYIRYQQASVSAQNGISRELTNPALGNLNVDGSNWADALVTAVYGPGGRGTPKAQNSTFTP